VESLRDWLETVDKMGELKRIDGADWNLEIGSILDPEVRGEDTSVLLFDNIKGYPEGNRILTSPFLSLNRISSILNIPRGSKSSLLETVRQKLPEWEAKLDSFSPKVVETGPVLENIRSGDEVDLFEFPVPKWHELDGGRYIGTGDCVITKDPETGEVNLGTYRLMVHDKKTTGLVMRANHHGNFHRQKYHDAGKDCPVAVVLGQHPLLFGMSSLPVRGCEYNWAGAISGNPVEVIQEEVTGLPIPADSEIVIVGWCPPGVSEYEGPFGEMTGYYAGEKELMPVFKVERVYHRNEPILHGCSPSRPPTDTGAFHSIFGSAIQYNELIRSGIPGVKGVWLFESSGTYFAVVSIKQMYPGHSKQAGVLLAQSRTIAGVGRYVIVVDEDIDPTNIEDVLWAMSFRSDPEKDIDILRRCMSIPLDPLIRKPTTSLFSSRAIIDACKPFDWINEFPKVVKLDSSVAAELREKWKDSFSV